MQKGAAISSSNTTSLSATDIIQLQRYILGHDSFQEDITNDQWIGLADANGDGILTSIDENSTYLPVGSAVWGNNGVVQRSNFTTEIQSSCGLIDGIDATLVIYEYQVWVDKI